MREKPSSPIRFRPRGLLAVLLLWFLLFEGGAFSCATRGNPDGGPRDTIPPQLDTAFPPNQSLHFKAQEIELHFNEYIKVQSPNEQIRLIPRPKEAPEILARGKKILIRLQDSLQPQTTYIISFGTSLADFTEGNVNNKFKYVFSTGDYIDSLYLSGSVRQAFSGEPQTELLVGLYPLADSLQRDSILYKMAPSYYAYLDEEGRFAMTNLKAGRYLLAAFSDKDGDFSLTSGNESQAFYTDTIHLEADSLYQFSLRSYEPRPSFRFFNARQAGAGRVDIAFRQKPADFKVEVLDYPSDSGFFQSSHTGDTLQYWFFAPRDSLVFQLNYDSLFVDSLITVRLRKMKEEKWQLKALQKDFRRQDSLFWRSNLPITAINSDSILRASAKDTLPVALQRDSARPFLLYYAPPHEGSLSFGFDRGALRSGRRAWADSTAFPFNFRAGEDLGSLSLQVQADSGKHYLLEIRDDQGRLLAEERFVGQTLWERKNALPGTFQAFLTEDLDSNGRWTPGDFVSGRQPERRIAYSERLEIRANWEIDLEWKLIW